MHVVGLNNAQSSSRYRICQTLPVHHAAPRSPPALWTWTAIDADTELIPSWFVGGRDSDSAMIFVDDLASRLANRVQLNSDGDKAYLEAVEGAFGADVDYAMLVKTYGASHAGPLQSGMHRG
jgi:hypothetical protein